MSALHHPSGATEIEIQLQQLIGKVASLTRPNTHAAKTAIPEMTLCHLEQPTAPVGWLYEPSIMIISSPFKAVTSMSLSVC
ncbi:hypothetical protein [Xenorhabdus bovienii]|uniref:hypothetical protein n=1 Tax=Xenorhabdus bovienii TaxID=40576 RepID=UPI00237C8986|nr:hypothetical protein [Xenorhabdus bovienii]MDE1473914.1 AraC family transcriptional regulator [Xenorhabdus bovienii]MDE9430036.1 AraC family transcriptional regulator [Xenorhabdus bovienii]MDE9460990.1 AraC family transcriptional regulator [Xenorhabdus bovienii]MDE9464886.1 AraC family transcriptional regulator [Xenorhabdus bovienii]MDE9468273.1 AraC family transcriptional regulator [Xenorhabdus bovienii]